MSRPSRPNRTKTDRTSQPQSVRAGAGAPGRGKRSLAKTDPGPGTQDRQHPGLDRGRNHLGTQGPSKQAGSPPLWIFLSEPGTGPLLQRELKFRKIVRRQTRFTTHSLRNHDLMVVPASQVVGDVRASRIAHAVLACPVFGRHKLSDTQLDTLAGHFTRERATGLVSSLAGSTFDRRDLTRWLTKQLRERGLKIGETAGDRPAWLLVVDETYWIGFQRFNFHDAKDRPGASERGGSLPMTVAAALAFAAEPTASDVAWDPTAGGGTVLTELAALAPRTNLIASDIDAAALDTTAARLGDRVTTMVGNGAVVSPGRRDVTLTIANLPWGKRFTADEGNEALYSALIGNALAHAGDGWRAVLLTSDDTALVAAARAHGLRVLRQATIRVRGTTAFIERLELGGGRLADR